jgi:AcrR family transcriptional regulator
MHLAMAASDSEGAPTERQQAVLDAVLSLMVEQGGDFSINDVVKRASCSKETLYKWYGDRDGILGRHSALAGVERCARATMTRRQLDASALRQSLENFAANWLDRHFVADLHRAQPCGGGAGGVSQEQPRTRSCSPTGGWRSANG